MRLIDDTAILPGRIRLTAVVNSETVTTSFVVTQACARQGTDGRLGAMSHPR